MGFIIGTPLHHCYPSAVLFNMFDTGKLGYLECASVEGMIALVSATAPDTSRRFRNTIYASEVL